jgi:hypothetical protein
MSVFPVPTNPTPSSERSFLRDVLNADPGYYREKLQPYIYEWSNGRRFIAPLPVTDFSSDFTSDFS